MAIARILQYRVAYLIFNEFEKEKEGVGGVELKKNSKVGEALNGSCNFSSSGAN